MSRRVVLHVGAMKSGTSFIQSRLFADKDLLAERGICVPGQAWPAQVQAARHLIEDDGGGMWSKLLAKMGRHDGTSVFSMEYLGPMRPAKVTRCVQTLREQTGTERLDVVVTARDLNRSVAAMWQETVQNGRTWTWPAYLDGIRRWRPGHRVEGEEPTLAGRTFWRQQNLVRMCRGWAGTDGVDAVHLVTVPHPGAPRDLLWQRFASVLGTDADGFGPVPATNESLGAASALAVRRLNELLDARGELAFPDGGPWRKGLLAKQVLAARKPEEPVIGLPVAPWVRDHAASMVAALQASELRLVGDWGDLVPVDVPGVDPATVPEAEVTQAAVAGLAGLLLELARVDAAAEAAEGR